MPPFLLPLIGLASLIVGLIARREAAPVPPSKEIHHHHYYADPRGESRVRRKRKVLDENPYEGESAGADESEGEHEAGE